MMMSFFLPPDGGASAFPSTGAAASSVAFFLGFLAMSCPLRPLTAGM